MDLITLVITIVVILGVGFVLWWAVGQLLPNPPSHVIQVVIIVVVALLTLLYVLRAVGVAVPVIGG